MSVPGPIAHTVADAAAMMDVLQGRRSLQHPESFFATRLAPLPRLRVRVAYRSPLAEVHPDVLAVTEKAARLIEDAGHIVEEGPMQLASFTVENFLPLVARMVANIPVLPWTSHALEPTTRWIRSVGRKLSKQEVAARHTALQADVDAWFGADGVDAWLTPTCCELAPRVGSYEGLSGEEHFHAVARLGAFTAMFNVSGQPAISLPAGESSSGLPIGIQLVMKRGDDHKLLAFATQIEPLLRENRV